MAESLSLPAVRDSCSGSEPILARIGHLCEHELKYASFLYQRTEQRSGHSPTSRRIWAELRFLSAALSPPASPRHESVKEQTRHLSSWLPLPDDFPWQRTKRESSDSRTNWPFQNSLVTHGWSREMCVVRLQDAWARFCRELVLISASEQPITLNGTLLPLAPGIKCRKDALSALRVIYNRPPWEPKWFDAQACLKPATILRISNYASMSGGIAVSPSPLDDLRTLRNFLVHRSEQTAADVQTVAKKLHLPVTTGAIAILLSNSGTTGTTMLELWVRQLQAMAQVAVR